jgi:hypothetical protein
VISQSCCRRAIQRWERRQQSWGCNLNNSKDQEIIHTNFLDKVGGFLDDFLESGLGPLGGVHLVDGNDELFDTKSVSEQSVLTGLSILGNTSFELTDTSGDDD